MVARRALQPADEQDLGDRNLQAALAFLARRTILVVGREVGGKGARKIVFDSRQGTAEVVHIGG